MNTIKRLLIALLPAIILWQGCYYDDGFENPPAYVRVTAADVEGTFITIKELKALYPGKSVTIDDDVVVCGKVTTSDEAGNLYRELFIEDSTTGIKVKIGSRGLYNDYKLGQTLFIKCKGLQIGAYGGMVELGYKPAATSRYETAYIDSEYLIRQHILRGVQGDEPTPRVTTMSEIINTSDLIGTLITVENMRFTGASSDTVVYSWATPAKDDGTDPETLSQPFAHALTGEVLIVRTSGYSRFAGSRIPSTDPNVSPDAPINLTGVLTVYGTGATRWQLTLRSLRDVTLR
ncbi:MAG: DUF5689 domain-containing protein [Prevotellaceae bacterium]|jgi:hypothetical protein|nr:DUF5689 domain-containing protein [Prevotellaceae bacterium]